MCLYKKTTLISYFIVRKYYKVFMPAYEQDEQALEHFNKFKRKISQNRLLLISAVNMITFALSIFSISYYKWVWIEIINFSKEQQSTSNQLWVNLLYGKEINSGEYKNFQQLKNQFCRPSDATCQALFIEFRFVGMLSFFMFFLAYILQLIDFYQIFQYLRAAHRNSRECQIYKSSVQAKDSFMHLVTILSYSIGLGLNFFSLTMMNLNNYQYGISFWMFFSSLIVFILCIVYKNISLNHISKRSLMLNLIEGEKKLRNQELVQSSRSSVGSSQFEV